ncbi:hypothetical protein SDJN02_26157, partial [Cucurbita argyrosperma subsp. argyrosperma]
PNAFFLIPIPLESVVPNQSLLLLSLFLPDRPPPSNKPHDVISLAWDAATFHGLNKLNWLPWPANPTANPSTWAELI